MHLYMWKDPVKLRCTSFIPEPGSWSQGEDNLIPRPLQLAYIFKLKSGSSTVMLNTDQRTKYAGGLGTGLVI